MIRVTPQIELDEREIEVEFVLASGPGGQNVNKVATAVQMRFPATSSASLPEEVRERLVRLAGRRMTKAGWLVITARRFRTQERNRQDALERLIDLVRRAAVRPKARRRTRPTAASRRERLTGKRLRGQVKEQRRPSRGESRE